MRTADSMVNANNRTRNASPPSTGQTSTDGDAPPPPNSDKSTSGEWISEDAAKSPTSSPDKVSKPSLYVPPAAKRSGSPRRKKPETADEALRFVTPHNPSDPQAASATASSPPTPTETRGKGSEPRPEPAVAGQKASRCATPTWACGAIVIALTAAAAAAGPGMWAHQTLVDSQPQTPRAYHAPVDAQSPAPDAEPAADNIRSQHSTKECSEWAGRGECEKNSAFMHAHCAAWCATDSNPGCAGWASAGECTRNPVFMGKRCSRSCAMLTQAEPEEAEAKPPHGDAKSTPNTGAVQQLTHGDEPRTRSSPPGQDTSQPANPRVSESLENRDARCSTWAARGECARNHVYMAETCAKACAQVEESSVDREPHCALWSSMGECERNPEFMALRCARSCAANTGDA